MTATLSAFTFLTYCFRGLPSLINMNSTLCVTSRSMGFFSLPPRTFFFSLLPSSRASPHQGSQHVYISLHSIISLSHSQILKFSHTSRLSSSPVFLVKASFTHLPHAFLIEHSLLSVVLHALLLPTCHLFTSSLTTS